MVLIWADIQQRLVWLHSFKYNSYSHVRIIDLFTYRTFKNNSIHIGNIMIISLRRCSQVNNFDVEMFILLNAIFESVSI